MLTCTPALAALARECKGCPETFCKGCHETEQKGAKDGAPCDRDSLEGDCYSFRFCVVVERFFAHLATPAGLFVAAEGKRGVEDVVAVNPDCS